MGAASGSWWTGDLDTPGLPEALPRGGAPPGYIDLALNGNTVRDTYRATARDEDDQMSLSISSPFFREWFSALAAWKAENPQGSSDPPPVNINDLGDPNVVAQVDLGHFSPLITWQSYQHVIKGMQTDAAEGRYPDGDD